jgi:hypothetical protein
MESPLPPEEKLVTSPRPNPKPSSEQKRGEGMNTRNKEREVTSIGIKAKGEQATEIFFFLWAGRLAEGGVIGRVACGEHSASEEERSRRGASTQTRDDSFRGKRGGGPGTMNRDESQRSRVGVGGRLAGSSFVARLHHFAWLGRRVVVWSCLTLTRPPCSAAPTPTNAHALHTPRLAFPRLYRARPFPLRGRTRL